jgi:HEAT repeat protein
MDRFLPKIFIDYSSFWAGALLAGLILYLIFKFHRNIKHGFNLIRGNILGFRDKLSIASESDYINILYRYVQGLHITSNLFPLDKISIDPKCIAPPPAIFPGKENLDPSLIQQTIGHDPYLPDLAVEYNSPTISLLDALSTDTSIFLVGLPGTGKTVAIADCISKMIKLRPEETEATRKIPFYTKAHHILAQFPGSDLLTIILTAIQENQLFNTIPSFPKFLTSTINSGRAVLFIDDLDLLNYTDTNRIANFLTALSKSLPNLQLVVTATPSCLGYLPKSPLAFVSIAPWGDKDKYSFLKKWSKPSTSTGNSDSQQHTRSTTIKDSMLVVSDNFSTPIEFVLKTWSAYAGDLAGPSSLNAVESYLKRVFSTNTQGSLRTLEIIAFHNLKQEKSSFTRKDIRTWFAEGKDNLESDTRSEKTSPLTPVLQAAHDSGIIQRDGADGFYFSNPTIGGYLAAKGLSKADHQVIIQILKQPGWALFHEAMRFFAGFIDIEPFISQISSDPSLLKEMLIRSCSWLTYTDKNKPGEIELLKTITREIHTNPSYLVKLRLVISLAKSGNPNAKSVFQHLQKSQDLDIRRAAALGSGLIKDLNAVPQLISQLNDVFPASTAACYALGRIGSPRSLESIADGLLHGNELLRRAAAESLAQNRSEGHPALREGASMKDLLVRYAVVHGLSMIAETWAIDILDSMRIDEDEWVVRDLAQQVYEMHEKGSPYRPHSNPPSYLAPWLHEFTSKQELPAPAPETALEVLLQALETGTDEQKQAALIHLGSEGNPDIIPVLTRLYRYPNPIIRQQAMLSAWFCLPPSYTAQSKSNSKE